MDATLTQKLVAEFIGTFFLMLGILLAVTHSGDLAPLAIGGILTVLVFACGHISGAHFNPAVSVGLHLRGLVTVRELLAYIVVQVLAAAVGAGTFLLLETPGNAPEVAQGEAFLVELLFTFVLMWVILNVATSRGTDGNSFYGLAIGFTVMAGAFMVGGISGAAFNPAIALGGIAAGLLDPAAIWIYLLACPLGAVAAVAAFRFASPEPVDEDVIS